MSSKNKKSGFTLIEIMMASVVVAIMAAGGFRFTTLSAQLIQYQKDSRCADVMASRRMELLLARPYADYIADATALNALTSQNYFFLTYHPELGTFSSSNSDSEETTAINNTTCLLRSRARVVDTSTPGSAVAGNCVELEIRILYGPQNKRSLCLKNYHTY